MSSETIQNSLIEQSSYIRFYILYIALWYIYAERERAVLNYLQQLILWDFFDERDDRWMYLDLEDIPFFSDSDDSDWSDYELSFD